jgi:hypothetical protein
MKRPSKVVTSKCINHRSESYEVECSPNRAILYALGVGASRDPLDQKDLTFTYEKHDEFQVIPTLGNFQGKSKEKELFLWAEIYLKC